MRRGAAGACLIEYAAEEKGKLSDDEGVTVWVLVDLEMSPDSDTLTNNLRNKATKHGVKVLLSQPCFEVWILLHFVDTGRLFTSCDHVLREVKKQWKVTFEREFPRKKAQADYQMLMDRITNAATHARSHDATKSRSWTEIWQVAEYAKSFVK